MASSASVNALERGTMCLRGRIDQETTAFTDLVAVMRIGEKVLDGNR